MERIKFDLEELHSVQIDLMKRFMSVCEEQGLRWFLGFGSLLGAVRDHKIIEWDDSVDVVMPYDDYARLLLLSQETWGDGIFLQTYESDKDFPKYYAKLRNSNTTLILSDYTDIDMNQGIYINIFPLIRLADDEGERKKQIRNAKQYKQITEKTIDKNEDVFSKAYSSILLGITTEQQKYAMRDQLKDKILMYEEQDTEYCFALAANRSLELPLKRTWFSSAVSWEFEGIKVNIPVGWDEWLSLRYGDYRRVPIAEIQTKKTVRFVTLNAHRPYIEYKGKTYCVR